MDRLEKAENHLAECGKEMEHHIHSAAQVHATVAQAQAMIVIAQELRKLNERAEELEGYQSGQ